mmetsp:Transcript_105438/g.235320  ORF Transcript_105438/g.235320 Transcript_105438/m.235320 type:complete len:514 (-) Transcript_105438:234-1775(-)
MAKGERSLQLVGAVGCEEALGVEHYLITRVDLVRIAGREHDGQFPTGRSVAEQHRSCRSTSLLAAEELVEDGRDVAAPRRGHCARCHHIHHRRFLRRSKFDSFIDATIHSQGRAIKALAGECPADCQHDIRPEDILLLVDGEDLHAQGLGARLDQVKWSLRVLDGHRARAATRVVHPRVGRITHHTQLLNLGGIKRENAVVLEQDQRLGRRRARQVTVLIAGLVCRTLCGAVRRHAARVLVHAHAVHGRENVRGCLLDVGEALRLVQVPCLEAIDLHEWGKAGEVAWHLNVHAIVNGPDFVHSGPVGHHNALEAHLLPQVAHQQVRVGASIGAVHLVVRAHDTADSSIDSGLERRIIQLPSGAVVDLRVLPHAVRLLLVEGVVLRSGHNALALHTFHVSTGENGTQVRVLAGDILEVSPVPCDAVHVHRGSKDDIGALAVELGTDRLGHLVDRAFAESGGQGQQGGPTSCGTLFAWVRGPEAVSGIGHLQRRHAQAWDGLDRAREVARLRPSR